ncbi:MAG TPA: TonB-dependent receptor, partial [Ignavibacteria bacterium]|nr:TonB-dependent receptor [Ignavibacteria bacterium]
TYYIVPRNTGELNYATFLPIYQTEGVGALFYGIEGQIQWEFMNNFRIGFTLSHTKGNFKNSDQPLPQIPPLKGNFEFIYFSDHLTIGINSEVAAAQNRVDEFEETTAGYGVLNSFVQYSISNENLLHLFSLSVDNIFNKEYRNHLSRVKSILPEAGRNFRLTYKLYFHL